MSEIPEDLKRRYELAKAQLALIPHDEDGIRDEWFGLFFITQETMSFIERIAKAEQASADHLKELEGLRADVKSLEESLDAQFAKFEGCPHKPIEEGLCGCSFDRIGDVCAHHAPALAELRAQLRSKDEQLAGMREWISVEERLPAEGDAVLVHSKYWVSNPFVARLYCGEWEGEAILSRPDSVTHWQPLPEPPALSGPLPAPPELSIDPQED